METKTHTEAVIKELLAKVQSMYSREGYFKRFEELCQENPHNTYKANYHLLELEHIAIFGEPRYKDYHGFRAIKSFKQNKLLNKLTPISNK